MRSIEEINAKIKAGKVVVATAEEVVGLVKDKGVKKAPFYVLLGAQMPAILIETSFISNEVECKRLVNPDYQDALVESITNGVKRYIRENNPTASFGKKANQG